MKDEEKSKDQLIEELVDLRKLIDKKRIGGFFLQTLLDLIEDPVAVVDQDYKYVFANRKAAQLLNVKNEEILSRSVYDLFPEKEAKQMVACLKSVFENRTIVRKERQFNFLGQPMWLDSELVPIKNFSGVVDRVLSTSRNITELKEKEERITASLKEKETLLHEIQLSKNRFKDIADLLPGGIVEMDARLNVTYVNQAGLDLFGYSEQDLKNGLNGMDIIHPDDRERAVQRVASYKAEKRVSPTEYRALKKDGTEVSVLFKAVSIHQDGEITGFRASITDISRLKQAENKIRESEKKHREILERLNDTVFRVSLPEGRFEYISKTAKDVFGYEAEEFLNNPMLIREIIHPDYLYYFTENWTDLINGIVPKTHVYKIINPEGREKWILQSNSGVYDDQNNIIAIEGLCRDITKQKGAEDQIKVSLKEKETLLHEIHHRVKNNMSVISALLSLQMNNVDNQIAKEALQDSQNRVQSMSMIHETLYQSDNLSAVDLKTYLSELGRNIIQNYSVSNKVQLKVEAENIMIGVKQASPVGLIVNELITNSLKYAFADDREGVILLELKSNNENGVEMAISDNGIGILEGFNLQNADSFGLKLIKTLVENQLNGSIDMESKNGTKFTIKFNMET